MPHHYTYSASKRRQRVAKEQKANFRTFERLEKAQVKGNVPEVNKQFRKIKSMGGTISKTGTGPWAQIRSSQTTFPTSMIDETWKNLNRVGRKTSVPQSPRRIQWVTSKSKDADEVAKKFKAGVGTGSTHNKVNYYVSKYENMKRRIEHAKLPDSPATKARKRYNKKNKLVPRTSVHVQKPSPITTAAKTLVKGAGPVGAALTLFDFLKGKPAH